MCECECGCDCFWGGVDGAAESVSGTKVVAAEEVVSLESLWGEEREERDVVLEVGEWRALLLGGWR